MLIGIIGLAMLYCIMNELWWALPFLVLGVEVFTGFSGSMAGWVSGMGDGE